MQHRPGLTLLSVFLIASACSGGSDAADTAQAAIDTGSAAAMPADTPVTSVGAPTIGVDQMPATAVFTVTGPQGVHQWNGSWNIKSNRLGCGVNTYPKMINFGIADEDNTRGDFQELTIGTNDGPDVGGTTTNFGINLSLERPGPNLSIQAGTTAGHTGTLTVVENANGNSRLKVTAQTDRGLRFDGQFTCVPRTP